MQERHEVKNRKKRFQKRLACNRQKTVFDNLNTIAELEEADSPLLRPC
jgi:hypothetical protein